MTRDEQGRWLALRLPCALCPVASAYAVGALSEEAVERVLVPELMPWWFLWARRATLAEDEIAKFDFAVYTRDVGRILLQVKSSRAGAEKHAMRMRFTRPLFRVHVVVARYELPREVVLGRVLAACIVAREEAFAGRCAADHPKLYGFLKEAA